MCFELGEFCVCMGFVFFDFDFVFMSSAFDGGFGLCFRVLALVFVFVGCFGEFCVCVWLCEAFGLGRDTGHFFILVRTQEGQRIRPSTRTRGLAVLGNT